jgi:hypothetical protein
LIIIFTLPRSVMPPALVSAISTPLRDYYFFIFTDATLPPLTYSPAADF